MGEPCGPARKQGDVTKRMQIVICGLSITSSWGNGHATTYRALVRALTQRCHQVLFLERDKPWYASNRDMPSPPYGTTKLYRSLADLDRRFRPAIANADFVIIGSFVPQGVAVAEWVLDTARGIVAFYDIDTPVTLGKLYADDTEYLSRELIPSFDLYLSFTGGPTLKILEREFGARFAAPLYCSVDPDLYFPQPASRKWELGYLGTYSDDRQPNLERLMLEPAARMPAAKFVVAGSLYPTDIEWPANVMRIDHLPGSGHRKFYNSQKFTLNVTRRRMIESGYSPSVRLFEAGACGVPIISDRWRGIEEVLEPGKEILIADSAEESAEYLRSIKDAEAVRIGKRARARILAEHTSAVRSSQLETYFKKLTRRNRSKSSAAD
jgi:spore maturation protein CgeB